MSQNPYPDLPRMAEPVEYSTPADTRARPGILTAVGITSIIMAVLGFGAAGVSGMFGLGMYMMGVTTRNMSAKSTTPAVTVAPSVSADVFTASQPLNPLQLKQLQQLLNDHAAELAGTDTSPGLITDSESKTGADGAPFTHFTLRTGKLEVYDDHAMFVPTSGYPIRNVIADPNSEPGGKVLSDKQVDKIVTRVQTLTNNSLNPAQTATLRTRLLEEKQGFIPMPHPAPEGAITHAMKQPDGSVMVYANNGYMMIAPDGSVPSYTTYSAAALGPGAGMPKIDESAAMLTIITSVLNLILSVFLLVIGIFVLNDSRHGRILHKLYAYVKLLVVVGGGMAGHWLLTSLMSNNPGGGPNPTWFGFASVIGIAVGCIYPIALLIVFGTRRVREYYSSSWIGTYR